MKRIAIIGATGYTGRELVRFLRRHPQVEIAGLTSEQYAGKPYSAVYPEFLTEVDQSLEPLDVDSISKRVELVFLCLPHGQSIDTAIAFLKKGVRVIDLSADFRLKSKELYEAWYEGKHPAPELLKEAVYAIPELLSSKEKEAMKQTRLVANPGCYPTSVALGLAPLFREKAISLDGIICDSKSGTSGAGRSAAVPQLFAEVNDNFYAYKVATHRHTPEIDQMLSTLAGRELHVQFTPHLLPITRGILSTLYVKPTKKWKEAELRKLYRGFYADARFVRILGDGAFPQVKDVALTNFCDIGLTVDPRTGLIVVVSVIDNLVKGASGQAVQNMNLLFGFEETLGLL